jgi:hypothetical protein
MQAAKHELYPRASATLRPATCDLDGGGVRSTEEQSEEELTLLKKTENRKQKQAKYLSALLELGCSEQF